ncbi:DUF5719 family protein [Actinomadura alba]|uniref:Secreted protein n=1 Tax=Actinomadura alba TaxID=406431 RepID=A0ABR7LIZ9_9ACTN|nr:DUF5719 family protein [Actinomadura alba]MBC6464825.1 hypothetical protein [Actinomadura alba]
MNGGMAGDENEPAPGAGPNGEAPAGETPGQTVGETTGHLADPAPDRTVDEPSEQAVAPGADENTADGGEAGGDTGRSRRAAGRARPGGRRIDLDVVMRVVGYRYATALLVLLALLALYGVAAFSRPSGTARAQGGTAPVTSAVLGCPAPAGARISALSVALPGSTGRVDLAPTKGGAAINVGPVAGAAWSKEFRRASGSASGDGDGNGTTGSHTVRADGALAGGLEVEQTSAVGKGDDRGLAGVRCTEPGTDMWFLGPGPVDAEEIEVHLTNVDDQPAAVDTLAMSGEGPLDTTDGRGTSVPPHSDLSVRIGKTPEGLGDIVETARVLALNVRVTTGRVAAAVRIRVGDRKGVDWLPAAAPPATDVVVPGIPGGSGRRQLLVAVPGEADARVGMRVMTPDGSFAPEGRGTLDAPAQTVTPVDLERALSGKPAAIRLTSDRPIAVGFTVRQGADVAYGSATPPLGPGPLASGGVVSGNRDDTVVLLTAPTGAASVRVSAVGAQGAAGSPQEVKIAAERTVQVPVPVPPGGQDGFGVLITPLPGSGPVYAARVLSTGKGSDKLLTILPVGPALVSVARPPVGDSLTSLIP